MKTIVLATSMFAATLGCSAMTAQQPRHVATAGADSRAEMRGATPVRGRRAKALLSGPAVIKHLETDGRGVVTLYLTDDPGTGDRACPSAGAEERISTRRPRRTKSHHRRGGPRGRARLRRPDRRPLDEHHLARAGGDRNPQRSAEPGPLAALQARRDRGHGKR